MKVLFAMSKESASEEIVKRYQKEYKEIISYKNVYYFNAILKEIQKDKSYDRIVISEDLEAFSNNNYDAIDKFIFEKLDEISDEAQDIDGNETSIILLCSERHTKGCPFLVKLFGIGIYNALLGRERSYEQVCRLINKPRLKKEAKIYYQIDSDDVNYNNKNSEEVSELEIQNILTHFKKLGKNTDKFADSFNNIAAQYTDDQLKIIVNCLPNNVKLVLEDDCKKYQELMSTNGVKKISREGLVNETARKQTGIKIDMIENKNISNKMSGPIVIPSSVRNAKNKGPAAVRPIGNNIEMPQIEQKEKVVKKVVKRTSEGTVSSVSTSKSQITTPNKIIEKKPNDNSQPEIKQVKKVVKAEELGQKVKKVKRVNPVTNSGEQVPPVVSKKIKKIKKDASINQTQKEVESQEVLKKGRGRPRKTDDNQNLLEEFEEDVILPGIDDDFENEINNVSENISLTFNENEELLPGIEDDLEEEELLPGMEDDLEEDEELLPGMEDDLEEEELLPGMEDDLEEEELLPGMEDDLEEDEELLPGMEDDLEEEEELLPGMEDDLEEEEELLPGMEDDLEEDEELLPGMEDDYEEFEENDDTIIEEFDDDDDILTGMIDDEYDNNEEIPLVDDTEEYTEEVDLPGLDDLDDLESIDGNDAQNTEADIDDLLPGFDEDEAEELLPGFEGENDVSSNQVNDQMSNEIESIKPRINYSMSSLNSLLTKDKKIVTFVGTSKNGTSFLINNLAALFSSLGINTAILDMTKNKNSYYIYTNNEEELRNIAYNSISKLQSGGYAEGIKVGKNLSVYTALPNDGKDYSDAEPILSTLVQNHSLILIDCDFDTDPSYFASCQEIYLVQSMDILTIQPLTAFLRDLKSKGVLESEKVRVVINKELKVRSLTTKAIINGMSFYNDPSMSFMTELFSKDVKACSIPFDENAYSKYLDAMVNCNVSINGYSKQFMSKLRNLGDMVYPLVSKSTYGKTAPQQINYGKTAFSNNMNNTLNQMKKKY